MNPVSSRSGHLGAVMRLTALDEQISQQQQQISTARRVTRPADDPVAFARAATIRRVQAAGDADTRAIQAAERRLASTDVALDGINNILLRARDLALQGANGTLNAQDRALLAREVAELRAAALGLAETRDADGRPLFGGSQSTGPAYAPDANGVPVWQGSGQPPAVQAGGSLIAAGITGPEAFGDDDALAERESLFTSLAALETALAEPDPELRGEAMAQRLTQLDGHVDRLATARATVGARGARLEAETERLATTRLDQSRALSALEDLDMPEAIARMQRLLTVLEAAQASFARVSALSLWDQLR